jgi:hypothetical protein
MTWQEYLKAIPPFVHEYVRTWSKGRVWWYRLPLLVWMVWLAFCLTFDREYQSLFSGINLGIHEMGHMLWRSFGQTMATLGGSLTQCLAPLLAIAVLLKANDCFGVPFCLTWLGTNLAYVAVYMADARARILPLVSVGGGEVHHDWEYLFYEWGLINSDTAIAGFVTLAAIVVLWAGVALGVWVLWMIHRYADDR